MTKADLQTAKETIPETLEMPSWIQHLLSEITSIKRHMSAEVKTPSKDGKKTNWQ